MKKLVKYIILAFFLNCCEYKNDPPGYPYDPEIVEIKYNQDGWVYKYKISGCINSAFRARKSYYISNSNDCYNQINDTIFYQNQGRYGNCYCSIIDFNKYHIYLKYFGSYMSGYSFISKLFINHRKKTMGFVFQTNFDKNDDTRLGLLEQNKAELFIIPKPPEGYTFVGTYDYDF